MLADRSASGGRSRQKCLATTRASGRQRRVRRAEDRQDPAEQPVSAYGGSTRTRSNGRAARSARREPAQRRPPRTTAAPAPARPVAREVRVDHGGRAPVLLDERAPTRRRATAPRSRRRRCRRTGRGPRAPGRSGSRIAKSVCLTRSASGRVPGPGARSRTPRPSPRSPARRRPSRSGAARRIAGPDAGQPAALRARAAARRALRPERARPRRAAPPRGRGRAARAPRARVLERRDAEPRQAALDEAEDVALPAQLEVLLASSKPSRCLGDRLQPRLGRLVVASETRTQKLSAVPRPTRPRSWWSWASPNRSAPSIDHHRRLGDVDPDLDDGRPDSTSRSPSRNRPISASRSAGFIRPWTMPTRSGARSSRSRSASLGPPPLPRRRIPRPAGPRRMSGGRRRPEPGRTPTAGRCRPGGG